MFFTLIKPDNNVKSSIFNIKINKHVNSMSLIATIFILFIISLITQFLLNISHHNITEINFMLQGQRALFAAKSGITWGITHLIINKHCPKLTTISLNQAGLTTFEVTVSCNKVSNNLFTITALAYNGSLNNYNYVTRTITYNYQLNNTQTVNSNLLNTNQRSSSASVNTHSNKPL